MLVFRGSNDLTVHWALALAECSMDNHTISYLTFYRPLPKPLFRDDKEMTDVNQTNDTFETTPVCMQ